MEKKSRNKIFSERIRKAFTKRAVFNCWKLSVALFVFVFLYEFARQIVWIGVDPTIPLTTGGWDEIFNVAFAKIPSLLIMSLVFTLFLWVFLLFSPDVMETVFRMLGFEKDEKSNEKKQTNEEPEQKEPDSTKIKPATNNLDDEKKKALRIMYKNLHYDNWQRGQGIWIANSILITGSLFVIFQSNFESVQTYLVSLMLVFIANFLHLTTDMVTAITYKQMEKIGHELGLDDIKKNYELEIKNQWWYPFRKGASYVLFSFLIASYLFLWFNDLGLSVSMFVTVLLLNLVAIFYYVYFKK